MATADELYREKIRARAEQRSPVISAPVVVRADAPVDERYRAKLAAREAAKAAPEKPSDDKAKAAKAEPVTAKPEPAKATEKPGDDKRETKPESRHEQSHPKK